MLMDEGGCSSPEIVQQTAKWWQRLSVLMNLGTILPFACLGCASNDDAQLQCDRM